jgi:hypothetical protein
MEKMCDEKEKKIGCFYRKRTKPSHEKSNPYAGFGLFPS